MGLCELENGKRGVVVRVEGGCGAREHLLELGLVPGVPVRMLEKAGGGPLLLEVLGSRVILGRGIAGKVIVR
ncbi:MAG TPA: FeoA domain-containing protein [Treponemataceae bacterium]|nr:FeoA domain-containing protein [Treponemataceae bacterium]